MIRLICGDILKVLPTLEPVKMGFLDPPDGIGLRYNSYKDNLSPDEYIVWLGKVLDLTMSKCDILWVSYNSKYIFEMGKLVCDLLYKYPVWGAKSCIQIFTFGQNNQYDLGNGHRPLVRLMKKGTQLYPDAIRVKSWRQEHGDKRADPRGRVPLDVFNFPRVTGNSKQRRSYHPTQLHEGLVERCVKLCCGPEDTILDGFSGTGTTLRICKRLNQPVIAVEIDLEYCRHIVEENELDTRITIANFEADGYEWYD